MKGISQRDIIISGWDKFENERKIFLKFWTEYLSERNGIFTGYLISPCERNIIAENQIIYDERQVLIPSIEFTNERIGIIFPICFSERNCIYKKYYVENSEKNCILFPICSNEKYIYLHFLKKYDTNKFIYLKPFESSIRNIITKLPPNFTSYNFRQIFCYYLPPNVDDRKISFEKYHIKFILPREFNRYFNIPIDYNSLDYTGIDISCFHYDYTDSTTTYDVTYCIGHEHIVQEFYDGDKFIYNINSDYQEAIDGTITSDYFENIEIGLDEGFDYGELFLVDLVNNNVYNLSLDSLFNIDIYGQFSRELYLISNQNNLFIRPEIYFNYNLAKEIFPIIWENSEEDKNKFRINLLKEFLNKGYLRIKINTLNLSWKFMLFKRFPKRFLVPFEIYIDNDFKNLIIAIELVYYFPYRFSNMDKKYKVLLRPNYI